MLILPGFRSWLIKRIITYIVTMYLAISLTFLLFHLIPANPVEAFVGRIASTNPTQAEQARRIAEEWAKQFGLDKPLHIQYICFMKELILHGNLGPSIVEYPSSAQVAILRRLPWTIGLLGVSIIISWTLGLFLGAILAWKKDKLYSKALVSFLFVFSQVPFYIIAIILILVFSFTLGWLPYRGAYSPYVTPSLSLEFIVSVIRHSILPALSIIITQACGWALSTRYIVITILDEDYLKFAEAKGLKSSRIFKKYILRNALLPQVTGLGTTLGYMMGGQIVLESIFQYPGIGSLFAAAAGALDYNVLIGIMIIIIFTVLTANLLLDIIYPLIDPRVRYGGG